MSDDDKHTPLVALLDTPMLEVARVISELGRDRQPENAETQALAKAFETYLGLSNAVRSKPHVVDPDLGGIIAQFAINAMMRQHRVDRGLFAQSLPPFGAGNDDKPRRNKSERSLERRSPTTQRQIDAFRRQAQNEGVIGECSVIVREDERTFTVQIELEDDQAIVLTYWKDEPDPPAVSLWTGNGSHDFGSDNIDDFREWVGRAVGLITAPRGACVDCDFDTFTGHEYYIVRSEVRKAASEAPPRLPGGYGPLCIGCLERRLGRELTRADFKLDNSLNQPSRHRLSARILDRLARE